MRSITKGTLYSDVVYSVDRIVLLVVALFIAAFTLGATLCLPFFNGYSWEVLLTLVRLCWKIYSFLGLVLPLFVMDLPVTIHYVAAFHFFEVALFVFAGRWPSFAGVISLSLGYLYFLIIIIFIP